jgi:transcriptional regulator with XRE-family HTH domain
MSPPALAPGATDQNAFGALLRGWRNTRGMSQLALSSRANVSARHLSYMETGRAQPSREMIFLLAQALEMPLRDRNAFLQAAGFAPVYRETPLAADPMGPVRDALDLLLRATEPNPTFVLNRRADVLATNGAGRWLLETFNEDHAAFAPAYNLGKVLVSPKGDRAYIENWAEVARLALTRLKRDLGGVHVRDSADEELLGMISATLAELGDPPPADAQLLVVPVRFRRGELAVNLFSTLTTLARTRDLTLEELRIEVFFPADEPSKRVLESRRRT